MISSPGPADMQHLPDLFREQRVRRGDDDERGERQDGVGQSDAISALRTGTDTAAAFSNCGELVGAGVAAPTLGTYALKKRRTNGASIRAPIARRAAPPRRAVPLRDTPAPEAQLRRNF
jgi:hypothetical protein